MEGITIQEDEPEEEVMSPMVSDEDENEGGEGDSEDGEDDDDDDDGDDDDELEGADFKDEDGLPSQDLPARAAPERSQQADPRHAELQVIAHATAAFDRLMAEDML